MIPIMVELRKPPVRLHLGRKTLDVIVRGLEGLGWTTNRDALQSISMETMMINGNTQGAKFWHTSPRPINVIIFTGGLHLDNLFYTDSLLTRHCPFNGLEEVISSAIV